MVTTTEDIYLLIADVNHDSSWERHLIECQIDEIVDDLLDDPYMAEDDVLEALYCIISTESSVRPNRDQLQLFWVGPFLTASANLEVAATKIKERKSVTQYRRTQYSQACEEGGCKCDAATPTHGTRSSWAYEANCRCQACRQYRTGLNRQQKFPPCGDRKKHDIAMEWSNNCVKCNNAFVESFN